MNPESTAQLLQKFPLFEDLNDRDALIVASFVKEENWRNTRSFTKPTILPIIYISW
jgi:hypothetical protein